MVYGDFKYFSTRAMADKVLCDKVFNIAKNPIYDGYQRDLLQWSINYLIKRLQEVLLKKELCKMKK